MNLKENNLVISGNQDFGNAEILIKSGLDLLQQNINTEALSAASEIIVDCSELENINSAMVAILLQWKSWLQINNKTLKLKHPSNQLVRLLSLYNLTEQFPEVA